MAVVGVAEDSVVVEQSGHSLCVRSATDREGVAGPERVLRAEPGRTAVVVHASAADAVRRLDHRVLDVLGRAVSRDAAGRPASLRLLLSAGACPGSDGTPAVAARLAHHLGVEVVAPDGALLVSQRGELFSAGATAAWWAFVPGRSPALGAGPRFPAPAWQWHLPPDVAARASTVDAAVTPVPAGLWYGHTARLSSEQLALYVPGMPVNLPDLMVTQPGRPHRREGHNVRFVVQTAQGRAAGPLLGGDHAEVVLPRGAAYDVVQVTEPDYTGVREIHLRDTVPAAPAGDAVDTLPAGIPVAEEPRSP